MGRAWSSRPHSASTAGSRSVEPASPRQAVFGTALNAQGQNYTTATVPSRLCCKQFSCRFPSNSERGRPTSEGWSCHPARTQSGQCSARECLRPGSCRPRALAQTPAAHPTHSTCRPTLRPRRPCPSCPSPLSFGYFTVTFPPHPRQRAAVTLPFPSKEPNNQHSQPSPSPSRSHARTPFPSTPTCAPKLASGFALCSKVVPPFKRLQRRPA